jgi:hypothetical protein
MGVRRHWLWDAYRALTQERRMTESEAIGELASLWPSLPVLEIVRAEGDTSRPLAELIAAGQDSPQSSGNQQGQPSSQQGQPAGPAKQMTAQLDADFNAMLRARAGFGASEAGTVTQGDILNAGTGRKMDGSGAYKPEDDFVRGRMREKYGS